MPDDLQDIAQAMPDTILDIRYATTHNFTGKQVYEFPEAKLRAVPLEALKAAAADFRTQGLEVVIWDAYRSAEAQAKLRAACDDDHYVAKVSKHAAGITVDMTLARDGQYLDMGTDFDKFDEKAHANAQDITSEQRANRQILAQTMAKHGFAQLPTEWWHFDYSGTL